MKHPDWVLKHKQKNTEIRYISNRYYLYKITSKWDPIKKRTKKVTLGLIGSITQNGIIYTADRKKKRMQKLKTSALEFGASYILNHIGADFKNILNNIFPEVADEIFAMAIIRFMETAPFKIIKNLYDNSFLSIIYPNLKIGPNQISSILKVIGKRRDLIIKYMKHFISEDQHVLFDATHITSHSNNLDINHKGYNSQKCTSRQINLLYMFAVKDLQPVYYRITPGNIKEISSFKLSLKELGCTNITVVADKGFMSKTNIETLNKDNVNYIIPHRRNSSSIDYDFFKTKEFSCFDGYFKFEKRFIWYKETLKTTTKRIISYYDGGLAERERSCYLEGIDKEYEGYSMENYSLNEPKFGFLTLETSMSDEREDTEEIYKYYKGRSGIEQLFDTLKNTLCADRTYMRGEEEMEAWFLINHISMQLYYRLYKILSETKLLKKYSPMDMLKLSKNIRKIKINKEWVTSEINSKLKQFLEKCNLTVP